MKKKLCKYGLLYIEVALATHANSADLNEPAGSTMPPTQALSATVKNLPGVVTIYYDLPDDQNLKYIRTSYRADNMARTANASFCTDLLVMEGFLAKGEYDIELYSVSYDEVVSSPLAMKVNPDTSSYQEVRRTLVSAETFNDIRVNFDNPEKAKPGLGVIKKQAEGIWTQVYMYYTEVKGGDLCVCGLDAATIDFDIFVRDGWGRLSDTLYVTETPPYEEQCDESLFRRMASPTDLYECHLWNEVTKGSDMTRLWDEITDVDPCLQAKTITVMSQWLIFGMGENYRLSRFVVVSRYYLGKYGNTFKASHPKHFEVWGSINPNPDESSDGSWVLLSEYGSVKPSGGGVNDALTAKDQEAAKNDENFIIPDNAPAVRHIRSRTNNTRGSTRYMHLHELVFFGAKHNQ